MQPWVWLIIIVVVILVVWWLLSRSARQYETDFEIHHEEETHAPPVEEAKQPSSVTQAATSEAPATPKIDATPSHPDDLASLEGIGQKVNSLLQAAGITTFSQLAEAQTSRLEEILEANNLQFMDPSSWPEQAKLATEGKIEELHALQERLKGGRKVD